MSQNFIDFDITFNVTRMDFNVISTDFNVIFVRFLMKFEIENHFDLVPSLKF